MSLKQTSKIRSFILYHYYNYNIYVYFHILYKVRMRMLANKKTTCLDIIFMLYPDVRCVWSRDIVTGMYIYDIKVSNCKNDVLLTTKLIDIQHLIRRNVIHFAMCVSVSMSICFFVCPSVYLSVNPSVYLSVCLREQLDGRCPIQSHFSLLELVKYRTCQKHISQNTKRQKNTPQHLNTKSVFTFVIGQYWRIFCLC